MCVCVCVCVCVQCEGEFRMKEGCVQKSVAPPPFTCQVTHSTSFSTPLKCTEKIVTVDLGVKGSSDSCDSRLLSRDIPSFPVAAQEGGAEGRHFRSEPDAAQVRRAVRARHVARRALRHQHLARLLHRARLGSRRLGDQAQQEKVRPLPCHSCWHLFTS